MIRLSAFLALSLMATVAACQPQKTPEQIQAEKTAAVIAQIGAMAGPMAADMTPEERAKLQAITGAIASGQVHPAASAYFTGANKVFALLGEVKGVDGLNAIKPQVAAVYAEMSGPAATLKAMPEDQRDVAFGSAMAQMIGLNANVGKLMSRLSYDPETMLAVGEVLDEMPQID